MKNLRRALKRANALFLAVLMMLSGIALAESAHAADRTPADYVYTDYGHSYHLVSFLNGYNVIAFGNAHSELHMMGAMLVQGEYSGGGSNSGFADGEDLPPSFIKGLINAPNSVYNSRNHTDVDPLYVGSANTVTTQVHNGQTTYRVNGVTTGLGGTTPVYVNDAFFKFDEAYEVIKADQATMSSLSRAKIITPVNGVLTINIGDNVLVETMQGVSRINIIGELSAEVNTTINVMEYEAVTMPEEHINGAQPSVREQNEAGTAIVFNFPNASSITLPTQNWVGHVIAPDADVRQDSGNFNGTIICKNLWTAAEGHIYNYNTELTSWDTVFSIEKIWNDGHDADGIRPDSIQVELLADGSVVDTVTLTAAHNWYYVWPELPERNGDGTLIEYSVREINVPEGYTSRYDASTQTLINNHDYEEIDIRGTKTWMNEGSAGTAYRPATITIHLHADGVHIDSRTITVTDAATQTYEFLNLPKYKNGVEIKYTLHEEAVDHYQGTVVGFDLINTYDVETVDLSGVKTWNDDNDRDGLRPASVTIQLLTNGKVTDSVITSAANGWKYSFSNLPKHDPDGREIEYDIREVAVSGYTASYTGTSSGVDITNTHEPAKTSVSGRKTWNDNNDNDGKRPASIVITLLADNAPLQTRTVTAADSWAWSFTDLDKYYAGREITYTVEEVLLDQNGDPYAWTKDYISETHGMNLTNTHTPETIDIAGEKTWVDNDNNDGLRPVSITINLLQDGKVYRTTTVTAADGWKWEFTDLPRYTDGKEHVYTITENAVEGYTTQVNGYDVTNTHEAETIDILGHKVWNDNNNNDGKRPARLTVYLLADGERTGKYRTTTADRNWYWIFEDLPRCENGREIDYTFEEEAVAGYTGPVIEQMTNLPEGYGDVGYELTNTHEDEQVEITGAKTWSDENDLAGLRPDKITIRLWKTTTKVHEEVASKTVTENENWKWDFGKLPRYEDGEEIVYTITEDHVAHYSTVINGFDVTNSYTPNKISISGVKHWNDANDQDGKRPESITVKLLANGVEIASKTVTAADNWAWSFTDLDEIRDGKEVEYTIAEVAVPGYASVVDQYDLINIHTPELIDIAGEKTWVDADNQDGLRPERITIRLHKTVGGVTTEIKNAAITAANSWKWHFVDLPRYEGGEEIVYTITEDTVSGYETEINGYNVTNTHKTETVEVKGVKTWNDNSDQDGVRPASITIRLLADGVEIDSRTVTAADGWAWSFTDLPKFKGGKEIRYTIAEDPVADYETVISGYDVTNTYETVTIDVSGYKVWNDGGNRDGKRPASIVVNLLADDRKINSVTVTAANGWMGSFRDLPKYRDGGVEIVYTITEEPVSGYTSEIEGYIITNTYEPEVTSVSGSKTWNDSDNQDGKRPASITINLLADGVEVAEKNVTAADGWTWSFTNLPKFKAGKEIVYTITEDAVTDYTTVVSGYNVVNTYETETTSVSGSKTWNDSDNQDGKRPASITINLLADGVEVAEKNVTAADGWMWSFTNLPKFKAGKEIVYTITEDTVTDYTTVVSGYNVVNTYETETTSVSGSKTWNDRDNQDGKRPASITINLLADGVEVAEKNVTAADGWTWSFTNLPKFKAGKEIVYTITEDAVMDYNTTVMGYNIINSRNAEETAVSGGKTWVGDEDALSRRPESITINLLADGAKIDSRIVTEADGWKWSFTQLPKYKGGTEIIYTIEEEPVARYTAVVNGYNVTNMYACTNFAVTKHWRGSNGGTIALTLYANGEKVMPQPAPVRYGDVYVWEDLPLLNENGDELLYWAVEEPMKGYRPIYENYGEHASVSTVVYPDGTITNVEITSIAVRKVWADTVEGEELPAITLVLYCNGEPVDLPMPQPTISGWYIWEDLPAEVNGVHAHYTVKEEPVDGYMTIYATASGEEAMAAADGDTITNVRIPTTGDSTPLALWTGLLCVSAALLLIIHRRRSRV